MGDLSHTELKEVKTAEVSQPETLEQMKARRAKRRELQREMLHARTSEQQLSLRKEFNESLTDQDRKEMHQEARQMNLLLAAILLIGVWMACMIAFAVLMGKYVQPADNLAARLKPANCTINNAQKPYNGQCGKEYCVVVTLNFTVTQGNDTWVKQFDESWPLSDALNIAENFDTLFARGIVYRCFTDGTDLEIYIPNVESKRQTANALLILAEVLFIVSAFSLLVALLYINYKRRTDPTFEAL